MPYSYNLFLVLLSLLVAFLASLVSLAIVAGIRRYPINRLLWGGMGGMVMGLGIWLTHYVGMLAYHLPIEIGYDAALTLYSMLAAMVASAIAFWQLTRTDSAVRPLEQGLATLFMALGIILMHYLGIYSMRLNPAVEFSILSLLMAAAIALLASFYAIRFNIEQSNGESLLGWHALYAALVMALAIGGLHYGAMWGMEIDSHAICLAVGNGLDSRTITGLVVLGVMPIMAIILWLLILEIRLVQRQNQIDNEALNRAQQLAAETHQRLLQSEALSNRLLETIGVVVAVLDRQGKVVRFNQRAERTTGFMKHEVIGYYFWEKLIPSGAVEEVKRVFSNLIAGQFPNHHINPWRHHHGGEVLIEWSNTAIINSSGEVEYVIATGIDITESRKIEEALRIAAIAFETHDAIAILSADAHFLRVNHAFSRITGYSNEEVVGQTPKLLKSGRHSSEFYRDLWKSLIEQDSWVGEIWNRRKNGEIYPEYLRITAVRNRDSVVTHYVSTFSDLTAIKDAETQLSYYSHFDELTNLPNQRFFMEKLHREILTLTRSGGRAALFYIRMVKFNELQINIGRAGMEGFLVELANLLYTLHKNRIEAGYLGQGNFAYYTLMNSSSHDIHYHQMAEAAQTVIEEVQSGFHANGQIFFAHLSIGIALFPAVGVDAEEVLHQAWLAAEESYTRDGSNSYGFFTREIQDAAHKSHQMDIALRWAVSHNELALYYQPQWDSEQRLIGAEALLRWSHDGKAISPAEFIPLAEKSNLIIDIGNWVLQQSLRDTAELIEQVGSVDYSTTSINVSTIQLAQEDFVEQLHRFVQSSRVAPAAIKLEITETSMVNDPKAVAKQLARLREMGFSIALDDFGTGYSSLSYLAQMSIDQLKIDQSFVRDMVRSPSARGIVETIIQMSRSLAMDVIAEGVETEQEMVMLQQMGCFKFQGYYFARPMPFADFKALLAIEVEGKEGKR